MQGSVWIVTVDGVFIGACATRERGEQEANTARMMYSGPEENLQWRRPDEWTSWARYAGRSFRVFFRPIWS